MNRSEKTAALFQALKVARPNAFRAKHIVASPALIEYLGLDPGTTIKSGKAGMALKPLLDKTYGGLKLEGRYDKQIRTWQYRLVPSDAPIVPALDVRTTAPPVSVPPPSTVPALQAVTIDSDGRRHVETLAPERPANPFGQSNGAAVTATIHIVTASNTENGRDACGVARFNDGQSIVDPNRSHRELQEEMAITAERMGAVRPPPQLRGPHDNTDSWCAIFGVDPNDYPQGG